MEKRTEKFVKAAEDFVNVYGAEKLEAARGLANMHRYLVNSFFGVVLRFIGILAKNYANGNYDGRNEMACRLSKIMIDSLRENDEWGDLLIEDPKD